MLSLSLWFFFFPFGFFSFSFKPMKGIHQNHLGGWWKYAFDRRRLESGSSKTYVIWKKHFSKNLWITLWVRTTAFSKILGYIFINNNQTIHIYMLVTGMEKTEQYMGGFLPSDPAFTGLDQTCTQRRGVRVPETPHEVVLLTSWEHNLLNQIAREILARCLPYDLGEITQMLDALVFSPLKWELQQELPYRADGRTRWGNSLLKAASTVMLANLLPRPLHGHRAERPPK